MAKTIKERSEQLRAYLDAVSELERAENAAVWMVFEAMDIHDSVPKDWFGGVSRFLTQVPLDELTDAAKISLRSKPYSEKQRFKYFCGIAWRLFRRGESS